MDAVGAPSGMQSKALRSEAIDCMRGHSRKKKRATKKGSGHNYETQPLANWEKVINFASETLQNFDDHMREVRGLQLTDCLTGQLTDCLTGYATL